MTTLNEMTARELNAIRTPTKNNLVDAVELLIANGWQWKVSQACPAHITNPYTYGWWVNPNHETKNRPVGDPGNMHFKAWDTLRLYVAE